MSRQTVPSSAASEGTARQWYERGLSLHQQGRLGEAEACYCRALERRPKHFDALHMLGVVRLQQGNPSAAHTLISQAVSLRPQAVEALASASTALIALGRCEEALANCDIALKLRPGYLDAALNRALALTNLGRLEQALATFDNVLAQRRDDLAALFYRSNVLAAMSRYEDALSGYQAVLARQPDNADALINCANVLVTLGRREQALAAYARVLAVRPDHILALNNRGILLKECGRFDEALAVYERVLRIAPNYVNAINNRGNLMVQLGRHEEALADYERALTIDPHDFDTLRNCGLALQRLQRLEAALAKLEAASKLRPDDLQVRCDCSSVLVGLGRYDEAAAGYEHVLRQDPGFSSVLSDLTTIYLNSCDFSKTEKLSSQLIRAVQEGRTAVQPFLFLNFGNAAEQLLCARKWFEPLAGEPGPHARERGREGAGPGRIKLAYVSQDFYRHATAYLAIELLERHDRERFEVIGISYGPDDHSDFRARVVRSFDQFHDVAGMSDRDAAKLICDLHVDIAVDLRVIAEFTRPGILASRPAPVQVNYLGYPGTSGAAHLDYIIADPIVLPFDQQPCYTEKIVHVPDSYQANDATRRVEPDPLSRTDAGLPESGFVFCSFNQNYKIRAPIFDVWMRLLGAIEGSVLWLLESNAAAVVNLRRQAAARGIDPNRLVFAKYVRPREHFRRLRLADLFLDTLPYNAHTSARDALWSGVPLITCRGDTFASRVAASLLHAVGLPDLVTDSLAEYETLALRVAKDQEALAVFKQKLAGDVETLPLFNTDRLRRHIEAAYQTMWNIHLNGEPPRSFAVQPFAAPSMHAPEALDPDPTAVACSSSP